MWTLSRAASTCRSLSPPARWLGTALQYTNGNKGMDEGPPAGRDIVPAPSSRCRVKDIVQFPARDKQQETRAVLQRQVTVFQNQSPAGKLVFPTAIILKNTTGNDVARAPERFALRAAAYTHSPACFLCLAETRCLAAVPKHCGLVSRDVASGWELEGKQPSTFPLFCRRHTHTNSSPCFSRRSPLLDCCPAALRAGVQRHSLWLGA